MRCCIADLRNKEVVNVCDGKMLGYVCDVEIDINTGHVCEIIIPGENRGFGLSKGGEVIISWDRIEKIGEDTILVNLPDLPSCCREKNIAEKNFLVRFFKL